MLIKKLLGIAVFTAPALTQETLGCECAASTVTQYVTVVGPTVTVCPDTVSAAPATTSTKPYICAGDPCTSWVDGHSPAATNILTYEPTTITQYPVPPTAVLVTPTIHLTSTRTMTHTVKTSTTVTPSASDDCDDDVTSTITASLVTKTITTSEDPEPTTTTTEFSTVTERSTITFTQASSTIVTTIHVSGVNSSSHVHTSSHGHYSSSGFGSHGWNLTSSTARLNGTAFSTHRRPSHGGHVNSSAKWHTVTLPWSDSRNSSSDRTSMAPAHSHKISSTGWDLAFSTPVHHVASAIHHKSSLLATPYANTTSAMLVKRIVAVAEASQTQSSAQSPTQATVCDQQDLGNITFTYGQSKNLAEAATYPGVYTADHFVFNGYKPMSDGGSGTAMFYSPLFDARYEEAYSVFPGGVGIRAEYRKNDPPLRFDTFQVHLGCYDAQPCNMRTVGYTLNTTDGTEVEGASQWSSVDGCNNTLQGCNLTPVTLSDEFRNLTSIVFLADSESKNFWMGKLDLGWTKQDCSHDSRLE